jgi:hypothetical protein
MVAWHDVVSDLRELIAANRWESAFKQAIGHARKSNIPELD